MCVINYVRCLAYAFSDMDILNNICVVSACVDLQERTKMTSIIVWYGGFVHILFAKIEKVRESIKDSLLFFRLSTFIGTSEGKICYAHSIGGT